MHMREVDLGPLERIPLGEGRTYAVGSRRIAVFRTRSGELFATEALCPHAGGPLADGLLGDCRLLCPLHGFAFAIDSGRSLSGGCRDLDTFAVASTAEGTMRLRFPEAGADAAQAGADTFAA